MFQLSWTSLCGAEIQVTHDGSIISPHYPKAYARNLNCNYTIIAPGKLIYGEFKDFEVEESLEGNNWQYLDCTVEFTCRSPATPTAANISLKQAAHWHGTSCIIIFCIIITSLSFFSVFIYTFFH